jgi:hypothetical protein
MDVLHRRYMVEHGALLGNHSRQLDTLPRRLPLLLRAQPQSSSQFAIHTELRNPFAQVLV